MCKTVTDKLIVKARRTLVCFFGKFVTNVKSWSLLSVSITIGRNHYFKSIDRSLPICYRNLRLDGEGCLTLEIIQVAKAIGFFCSCNDW